MLENIRLLLEENSMNLNNSATGALPTLDDFTAIGNSLRPADSNVRLVIRRQEDGRVSIQPQAPTLFGRTIKAITGSQESKKNREIIEALRQAIRDDMRIQPGETREQEVLSHIDDYLDGCKTSGLKGRDIGYVLHQYSRIKPAERIDNIPIAQSLTEDEDLAEDILSSAGSIDNPSLPAISRSYVQATLPGRSAPLTEVEARPFSVLTEEEKQDIPTAAEEVTIAGKRVVPPPVVSDPIKARPLLFEHNQNVEIVGGRGFIVQPSSHDQVSNGNPTAEARPMGTFEQNRERIYEESHRWDSNSRNRFAKIINQEELNAIRREEGTTSSEKTKCRSAEGSNR